MTLAQITFLSSTPTFPVACRTFLPEFLVSTPMSKWIIGQINYFLQQNLFSSLFVVLMVVPDFHSVAANQLADHADLAFDSYYH